jgi:hypothetical protein
MKNKITYPHHCKECIFLGRYEGCSDGAFSGALFVDMYYCWKNYHPEGVTGYIYSNPEFRDYGVIVLRYGYDNHGLKSWCSLPHSYIGPGSHPCWVKAKKLDRKSVV